MGGRERGLAEALSPAFTTHHDLSERAIDNLGKAPSSDALSRYLFRIEGHTDTVGSQEYNEALSDLRATAVVDYLAKTFHIDRNRLEAIGMGKDGLLIPTPDQIPEPRNRRVQVVNVGGVS
jgi:outer membrane protein OmpA-like peptidoglycan-associated protein